MTLKQAFTFWALEQENIVLATKSRDAVQRVLLKRWNDIDLEQITETFARKKVFEASTAPQEMKAKAASILVHVLKWGFKKGYCQEPTFDFSIVNPDNVRDLPEIPQVPYPKPLWMLQQKYANNKNEEPNKEAMSETKPRGKAPKPVAQIDPETMEVVKVWPSRSEAEQQTGACNLDRCITMKRMSAGFFWCDPEDAETFKPNPMSGKRPVKKAESEPKPDEMPVAVAAAASASEWVPKFKMDDYVMVLRQPEKKGYVINVFPATNSYLVRFRLSGDIVMREEELGLAEPEVQETLAPAVHALSEYTDDELVKELERRGWEGELSRRQVLTIGTKQN